MKFKLSLWLQSNALPKGHGTVSQTGQYSFHSRLKNKLALISEIQKSMSFSFIFSQAEFLCNSSLISEFRQVLLVWPPRSPQEIRIVLCFVHIMLGWSVILARLSQTDNYNFVHIFLPSSDNFESAEELQNTFLTKSS